jgi:hypothetical protein
MRDILASLLAMARKAHLGMGLDGQRLDLGVVSDLYLGKLIVGCVITAVNG